MTARLVKNTAATAALIENTRRAAADHRILLRKLSDPVDTSIVPILP